MCKRRHADFYLFADLIYLFSFFYEFTFFMMENHRKQYFCGQVTTFLLQKYVFILFHQTHFSWLAQHKLA